MGCTGRCHQPAGDTVRGADPVAASESVGLQAGPRYRNPVRVPARVQIAAVRDEQDAGKSHAELLLSCHPREEDKTFFK